MPPGRYVLQAIIRLFLPNAVRSYTHITAVQVLVKFLLAVASVRDSLSYNGYVNGTLFRLFALNIYHSVMMNVNKEVKG